MTKPLPRRALAALAVLSLIAAGQALAASQPLSDHALARIHHRNRAALARLVGKPGGTAVVIGAQGELLAPAHQVRGERVTIELGGERREARVAARDPNLGIVLLIAAPGEYAPVAVGSASRLARGSAVAAMWFDARGKLQATRGRFEGLRARGDRGRRLRTTLAAPVGAVLFDARGRLVGLNVGPRPSALAIDDARARLAPQRTE